MGHTINREELDEARRLLLKVFSPAANTAPPN
jgi:hypothetical protein